MRRVFFHSKSERFDISDTARFGEPVYVMQPGRTASPFRTSAAIELIDERLQEEQFDPKTDFIGMTGGALHIAMLFGTALSRYKEIQVLMFDAARSEYVQKVARYDPT